MEKEPKALVPETPKIKDTVVPIPNYSVPHTKSKYDSDSRMAERKAIQEC